MRVLPEVSKYGLPDVKVPDVKLPVVKVPDVKLPEVKVPEVKVPEAPRFHMFSLMTCLTGEDAGLQLQAAGVQASREGLYRPEVEAVTPQAPPTAPAAPAPAASSAPEAEEKAEKAADSVRTGAGGQEQPKAAEGDLFD